MSQMENKPEWARPERRAPLRNAAKRVWHALTHNLWTKFCALFLAVLLWSALIASDSSLTREKVFANAEVTVSGQEALKSRGLIVMEKLEDRALTVRFKADVTQGNYERVAASNFGPRIDLSKIKQAGEQDVPIAMTSTSFGQIREVEPASVKVVVEEYRSSGYIPVEVKLTGELGEGLWADTPRADPILVSVGGPASMVDKVARVVVWLDQSILKGDRIPERNALPFEIQDAQGNVLDSPLLHVASNEGVGLDKILVNVTCYPKKAVEVDLESAVEGIPAEGYELAGITAEPKEVWIAAAQDALGEIRRALVDTALKIDGASETQSATLRIKRLTDAKHISVEEVTITAQIEEQVIERILRNMMVDVMGVPSNCTFKLSRIRMNATVNGGYRWLKTLDSSKARLFVDATGLEPGEYDLPVQMEIDDAQAYIGTPELETVHVTIAQK